LLVLDNCEHVLEACAELANSLLRACPGLTILATSREPLRIPGEKIWPVLPLPMPDGHHQNQPDALADYPAVRLFVERAQAVQPAFVLTAANSPAVASICSRLDGLPLAIELAAARIGMLSPDEIDARLQDRFKLLVGGNRTAEPRQQTLKAAISWSCDMLSPAEQQLFDRLSVFAGSFSLEAVESVCSGDAVVDPVAALASLVDRSLVLVEPHASGADTRYRLLESVRTYAWERLVASGEAEHVHRRQADWLVAMAERACAAFHGHDQGEWLSWAENEHANVQIVLQWLVKQRDADAALRVVAALWWPWLNRLRVSESRAWFEQVLALPGAAARSRSRGRALTGAGALAVIGGGDPARGRQWLEESLSIGLEVDDPPTIIRARILLIALIWMRAEADLEQLQASASDIVTYARSVGYAWGESRALVISAEIALRQGNMPFGLATLQEAVRVARASDDGWSLAMGLLSLGDLERTRGEHARAGVLYEESAAVFSQLGLVEQVRDNPHLLHNLGYVALAAGEPDLAGERFTGALALFQRLGDQRGQAESLIGIGATAAAAGRGDMAARLFGAADSALESANIQLWQSNRSDYEHWLGIARDMLESDAFAREWSVGRSMSLEEAVVLASKDPSNAGN
jgi:predicted ATPase/tetratricopeptide (TPR) repeat protein